MLDKIAGKVKVGVVNSLTDEWYIIVDEYDFDGDGYDKYMKKYGRKPIDVIFAQSDCIVIVTYP